MFARLKTSASIVALTTALAVAGCATPPKDPAARAAFDATNDPLEPMNRGVFAFNQTLDGVLIKPVALMYRGVVPEVGRNHIRSVLDNMDEPIVFANNVLQGRVQAALTTFWRFFFNSTVGIGGIFDPADFLGLKQQDGDFGQTLYSWGVPSGPFLMLPLFGPSDVRDAVGLGVDAYADPIDQVTADYGVRSFQYVRAGVDGVDKRARNIDSLDDLQRNSLDFYASLRSVYQQYRAQQLNHGKAPANQTDLFSQSGSDAGGATGQTVAP